MEKLEDKKYFNFSHFCGWEWKNRRMEKLNLYKFIHIPLLKNDSQLKQKSDKQLKKNPNY